MKRPLFTLWFSVILVAWTLNGWGTSPQTSPVLNAAKPQEKKEYSGALFPSAAEIEKKIEELKERVMNGKSSENEQTAQQLGVTLNDLQERNANLRMLQSAYERLLTALQKQADLNNRQTLLLEKGKVEAGAGVDRKPPYSLSFYDSLLDKLAVPEQQKKTGKLALSTGKRALEEASLKLEEAQRDWRLLREKFEETPEEERSLQLVWSVADARLEMELAETLLYLEKVKLENQMKHLELAELESEILRRKIDWVGSHLHYDEADLNSRLQAFEEKRQELKVRIRELMEDRKKVEEELSMAQSLISKKDDAKPDAAEEARLKSLEARRRVYQSMLEQTEDQLQLLEHRESAWRLRYALIKGDMAPAKISEQSEAIENSIQNTNRLLMLEQNYQNALRSEITGLEKELADEEPGQPRTAFLEERLEALQQLSEKRLDYISALLQTEQLDRRLLNEMGASTRDVSVQDGIDSILSEVRKIWDYEVWAIDNRPVTVRKLLVSIMILILGLVAANYIIRAVANRFLAYTHLKESTASAVGKMFKYFAYLLIVYIALRIVNIPLEAFAFLGGAIAIGVGFGAQNIINNFISGFIMMAERPISVGDLVDVEGILGRVEDIGARCTQIRTGENIHILVPNSSFLEKNITNWTFSDRKIRTKVVVGVIYGSPVREVERLLLVAVKENKRAHGEPAPFVLFNDFGDNALIFEVYFWISVRAVIERRMIESSLRFRIDELFREAGIVIAFPQRDVHLDAQGPLELRMLPLKE